MKDKIKVVTEPQVFLIGDQSIDHVELDRFFEGVMAGEMFPLTGMSESEVIVELAGRLCYMSFKKPRPGGNKAYLKHILEVGHGSVLEHAVYSMIITGVSRSLTHEFIRHRAGFGYSELSQRYVNMEDVSFVVPPALFPAFGSFPLSEQKSMDNFRKARKDWEKSCIESLNAYSSIVNLLTSSSNDDASTMKNKRIREAARSVLPNCTETKIFVTGNARAWRHFIELRADVNADVEIQRLAILICRTLAEHSPHMFEDIEIEKDGVKSINKKV
jgi:thymidylate synthase (FAD)